MLDWYLDTGTSHHITHDLAGFHISSDYKGTEKVHIGDGQGLSIQHIGDSSFYSNSKCFQLSDILHILSIKKNLLSVQKFCTVNYCYFEFHLFFFVIKDQKHISHFSHDQLMKDYTGEDLI